MPAGTIHPSASPWPSSCAACPWELLSNSEGPSTNSTPHDAVRVGKPFFQIADRSQLTTESSKFSEMFETVLPSMCCICLAGSSRIIIVFADISMVAGPICISGRPRLQNKGLMMSPCVAPTWTARCRPPSKPFCGELEIGIGRTTNKSGTSHEHAFPLAMPRQTHGRNIGGPG